MSNVRQFPKRDRNGIPILDPPHQANKLPRKCPPGMHEFVKVASRRFYSHDDWGEITGTEIESRCARCGETSYHRRADRHDDR